MILEGQIDSPRFGFSLLPSQRNFISLLFIIFVSVVVKSEGNICGSITTKSGDTIVLRENETLSKQDFDKVQIRKLKNANFAPKEKCIIKVCGYTSFAAQQDGCTGSERDLMDCHIINKGRKADTRYNDLFNASSISCGCIKEYNKLTPPCETKCHAKKEYIDMTSTLWKGNECAILYREFDCQECYFQSIKLRTGQTFATDNSHHINTIIVRDQCTVNHTVSALQRLCKFRNSPGIVTYISKQEKDTSFTTQSSFQGDPEAFTCTCSDSPPTATNTLPISIVSGSSSQSPSILSTPYLPDNSEETFYGKVALGVVSVGFIVASSLTIVLLIYRRRENLCSRNDTDPENDRSTLESNQTDFTECSDESLDFNPVLKWPLNLAFETSPEHFELGAPLGGGNFGDVCLGKLQVAVKTVKKNAENEVLSIKSLLHEIKILDGLGSHDNVIRFMGASVKDFENGEIYLLTEYCQNGCLKSYLKNTIEPAIMSRILIRNLDNVKMSEDGYPDYSQYPTEEIIAESPDFHDLHQSEFRQFLQWSEEIANGMQYITSKNVVHVDLSAKNVLLNHNLTAKIGDFGLSKKVYVQEYVTSKKESFPILWAAPECLKVGKYSSKSDIWAYGITLWEIFTLGKNPYNQLNTIPEVISAILRGEGLARAQFARDDVHAKLLDCWKEKPEDRPSFEELRDYFALLKNEIELEQHPSSSSNGNADSQVGAESE